MYDLKVEWGLVLELWLEMRVLGQDLETEDELKLVFGLNFDLKLELGLDLESKTE